MENGDSEVCRSRRWVEGLTGLFGWRFSRLGLSDRSKENFLQYFVWPLILDGEAHDRISRQYGMLIV